MNGISVILASILALADPAGAVPAAPERMFRTADMETAVARDGRIAFVSTRNGAFELYAAGADGKGVRQLTFGDGGKDGPAWSPDGRQIAFVSEAGGDADIHVIAAEGGQARRLTTSPHNDIHPFWSPDGKRIVFPRYPPGPAGADGRLDVMVMDADGANERRITQGTSASYGSMSPDGGRLTYWRYFGENGDIVVADAAGANERRMTTDPAFDGWPVWSPDGRRLAFSRVRGQEADIYLIEVDTGETRLLLGGPGRKTSPKWTADGKAILFDMARDGQLGIWKIAVT